MTSSLFLPDIGDVEIPDDLAEVMHEVLAEDCTEVGMAYAVADGWTAESFQRLGVLACYAMERQTPAAWLKPATMLPRTSPVAALCMGLYADANWIVSLGGGYEAALAWVALVVSAPDEATVDALDLIMLGGESKEDGEASSGWLALGAAGPVCWAAGLTLAEAQSRLDANEDVTELRLLGVLRGYLLGSTNAAVP